MFLVPFSDLWSRCLWIPLGPPYIVESKEGCSMLGPCMLHPIGIHFSLTSHMRKRLTLCSYQIISVNPSQFFVDAPTNLGLLWLFCLFFSFFHSHLNLSRHVSYHNILSRFHFLKLVELFFSVSMYSGFFRSSLGFFDKPMCNCFELQDQFW